MLPKAPERIGNFRIGDKLGHGGMGVVHRAWDEQLRRPVAIKFIHFGEEERHRERFLNEARAAAALNHPAIVQIHQILPWESGECIVMELIEGEPLGRRLRQGPLPTDAALPLLFQIAEGLHAAHGQGIVHRDLKAENVMVTADGRAKILDFGLAKQPSQTRSLTADGHIVGTLSYMSPEQASAGEVDARSDLFSFGVLAYRMLSGRLPFDGDGVPEVIARVCTFRQPPLTAVNRAVPGELSRLVDRLLEKAPAHRPQSAREVAEELARMLGTSGLGETPATTASLPDDRAVLTVAETQAQELTRTPGSKPHRQNYLLAAGLAVLVGLLAIFSLQHPGDDAEYRVLLHQAKELNRQGRHQEALLALREAGTFPAAVQDPWLELQTALAFKSLGQHQVQLHHAERAVELAEQRTDIEAVGQAYLARAQANRALARYEEAKESLSKAQTSFKSQGNELGEAHYMLESGRILSHEDRDTAVNLLQIAYQKFGELEKPQLQKMAAFDLGNILSEQGRLDEAEHHYREAEQLATWSAEERAGFASSLGTIYLLKGELAHAEERYQEARAFYETSEHGGNLALTWTNLGEVRFAAGKLEEAEEFHEKAAALNIQTQNPGAEAYDHRRLGLVALARDDLSEALYQFEQSGAETAETKRAIALMKLLAEDFITAEQLAREAAERLRGSDDEQSAAAAAIQAEALRALGRLEDARKEARRAYRGVDHTENLLLRLEVLARVARVRATEVSVATILEELGSVIEQAEDAGLEIHRLEGALARAHVNVDSGKSVASCQDFLAVREAADAAQLENLSARASTAWSSCR